MKYADRMSRLGTESAFEVLVRARALEAKGKDVVHLEIGEPDFATPPHIVEAGKQALDDGYTHYVPTYGLPELREAVAEHVSATRGISAAADQVVVTPGAKPVMFFALLALAEEGDEVIYPDPGFPIYESVIRFVGAKPVPVPLREERDFGLDVNELKDLVTDRTRLIILNSPQNPTGGMLTPGDLQAIAEVAVVRGIPVLADEIYCRLTYDDPFASIAGYDGMQDLLIILDGFSKTYAMTGWRIGYGVMPPELCDQMTLLMVNSNSCTAAFTQRAALAALTGPQDRVDEMVAEFRRRRDLFVGGLSEIPGIRCPVPKGAFYVFPNVSDLGLSSKAFADRLLEEAGVAALAGSDFGECGEGYVRFSYANSVENIQKAVDRIADFASRLRS